jgi:RsmE family RNA methyltransferase
MGRGEIISISADEAILRCTLDSMPPPPLPLKLIIALPRPKMMRRILQTVATMGVKEVFFINACKVDKSYWSTPWLSDEVINENLVLGLEQAKDTLLPVIHQKKLFKPFVEDELPAICHNSIKLIAHPGSATPCPIEQRAQTTLVIGPEGGFTDYEVQKIVTAGFTSIHLGARILRLETAIPAILAKLFPFVI